MENTTLGADARAFLIDHGINLFAVIRVDDVNGHARLAFERAGVLLTDDQRLVLLGSGGPDLWTALLDRGIRPKAREGEHPVDNYATTVAQAFIERFVAPSRAELLYPSPRAVPLIGLGEQLGWSAPSALGMGINADYGLWFAYRALILTDAALAPTSRPVAADPTSLCWQCSEQHALKSAPTPCVAACPSRAVGAVGEFELETCVDYRLEERSPCDQDCIARRACPVAEGNAYPTEQLRYHMLLSMPALKRWRERQ